MTQLREMVCLIHDYPSQYNAVPYPSHEKNISNRFFNFVQANQTANHIV